MASTIRGHSEMALKDEQVLWAAKEVVVKLIKKGRVTPSAFPDTFREIYRTIYETVHGKSEDPEPTDQ
jgi:hypothetical protein